MAVPHEMEGHILQTIDADTKCVLDLEIASVSFQHHPLFSSEHVLAQRLQELHKRYSQRTWFDHKQRLEGRLEALRRARNAMRETVSDSPLTDEQRERLNRYKVDIRAARQELQAEGRCNRQLLGAVLATWRELKELRQLQMHCNTPWQLRICMQREGDVEEEQQRWDALVQAEWQELEEETAEELSQRRREHKKKLAHWKKQCRARKKAHKKQQKDKEEASDGEDHESSSEAESEPRLPLPKEPKPPEAVDWAALRSDMMKRLTESFRPPGEPEISMELVSVETVTPSPEDVREQQRRLAVKRCTIFARLLYNDQEVCCTRKEPLGPKFEVKFQEILSLCITQWPQSLKVELYEENGSFGRNLIGEVFIPIPSHTTIMDSLQYESLEFSNSQVVTYSHSGVGSGTFLSAFKASSNTSCLYTTGTLQYRAGWATDESSGKILAPPEKHCGNYKRDNFEIGDLINIREGTVDLEKVKKWVEKSPIDPNDPGNSDFFNLLRDIDVGSTPENRCFQLDPLQSEFDFCTSEELENNPRLRLLYLRDRGEPEFRGMRMVPNREKEISEDVFKAYERRLTSAPFTVGPSPSDPLDVYRAWGQRCLQEVQQRVLKQCRRAQRHRKLHDMVAEDLVPDIGTLGLTFMQWLRPKRPLRPARKERKKVTVQSLGGQEVKLIVNVVRAFDIPVRKDMDTMQPTTPTAFSGHKFATVPVRPFVEATFQGVSSRTTTADGNNPTWNQDLQLPLRPPSGDFTPGNLQEMQDALHLHLFDEVVVDLLEDDRVRETNIHQRLERNWLGSLRIPFTTLYHNARIEGTFKLYSPPVLLGYEREPQHRQFSGYTGEMQTSLARHNATFLTLFITVQPALNPPEPFKDQLECSEPLYLQEHLQTWEQQVVDQFPHRRPKTLVVNVSGKSVCVTRFIRPLAPPVVLEGQTSNVNMAARFVSMIPMVAGSVLFPGLFDIWLSSDEVLRLLSGDSEDHAVLLCCYMLHQKRRAWVLLGSGVPHGPTAYVLERDTDNDFCLWDPATGQCYNVYDSFCPLRKVYCLFNDENIWANVQGDELLQRTRFDVTRRSDWLPAFGRGISTPSTSIQPPALEYTATSESAVHLLQDKIEKHLRDCLMKWRRTARTLWNRYCVAILRKLLPTLEQETWCVDSPGPSDHIHELQHILGSHKMCGFPINIPYTDMAAITESVKATGVHFCESPEVEFALAVYIHPYPNNVLSVWVYVASLVRRR